MIMQPASKTRAPVDRGETVDAIVVSNIDEVVTPSKRSIKLTFPKE